MCRCPGCDEMSCGQPDCDECYLDREEIVVSGDSITLRLPKGNDVLPDLAGSVVRSIIEDFRKPSARAGFCVATLVTVMLARAGARPFSAIPIAIMAGLTAERLYQMAEDVHDTAIAQREYLELQGRIAEEKHSAAGKV